MKGQGKLVQVTLEAAQLYIGLLQHPFGCLDTVCFGIFIAQVDNFLDTGLDNGFGAFVAWKQGSIYFTPLKGCTAIVQDSI